MSAITAILEADADGTLHLPLPEELRQGRVRVTATLQPVPVEEKPALEQRAPAPKPGSLSGFWVSSDFDEPLENFKERTE